MYIHPKHQLTDPEAQRALMAAHPLATWVCHSPSAGLVANHVPFFLDRSRGAHGSLIGHVARANPVWRLLGPETPSVLMFQGLQAYITPGWYPGKAAHGRVVPTWNYLVVHAHGVARAVHDRAWLLDMLDRLTRAQEAAQPAPWQVADAPAEFIDRLLRAIVGIEIPIERLEGKCKLSQDEAPEDRQGTVDGLRRSATEQARSLAERVSEALRADAASRS